MLSKLINTIKVWKEELWSIPAALLIFFLSPTFLRWIDPTAGSYDAGIFQIVIFAIICLLMFNGFAWMGIKQVFPEVFSYFQTSFKNEFNKLTEWQRIKASLFIWAFLLACLVFLARVL
jgi:hypothetical protein